MTAVLLVVFIVAVGSALARGIDIENCGCFSVAKEAATTAWPPVWTRGVGWFLVVRNLLMLAGALAIAFVRPTPAEAAGRQRAMPQAGFTRRLAAGGLGACPIPRRAACASRCAAATCPSAARPATRHYFFAYRIRISNVGEETVQLVSRHWIITDGDGRMEEVQGPGVVGEQPVLEPGESFEYSSCCPLPTPIGSMQGTYQMVTSGGSQFDAEIAPFSLAVPTALN